jgi:hypothetical protein
MTWEAPERADTGTSRPEKFAQGVIVSTEAAKMAATWVVVKQEMSNPNPVAAQTYTNTPASSAAKEPVTGTPNRNTARSRRLPKLTSAMTT